ncbi:MAG: ketoacyl-ACP synthase III [Lachnospiraceae bacterium]|jgi:3-oxoacyl-[acyl-carrier-protein] synthase-3|nr:ketoacyl-ACP synthase III [Lachnospiraceae bacterium]
MSIRIMGTGSALPVKKVANEELARLVDTSDEWIRERTGIGSRYISTGETVASLAARACSLALEDAGKRAGEVELILVATCSPEDTAPCTACQVQKEIGAGNAVAFDLNAACAGFLFALHTAWAYVESGIYRNVLVAGSEVLSKLVDWEDRGTCILFGDGAGAVYAEKCEEGGIRSFVQHSDGSRGAVLSGVCRPLANPYIARSQEGNYLKMDGREIFSFAVRQIPKTIEEALGKSGTDVGEVDFFLLHQANRRIIEGISRRLEADGERFPMNLMEVGNTSSASIPLLLDELNRRGRLQRGMKLVFAGFGAGLTCGACVLEW